MLDASRQLILDRLEDHHVVLDVGAGASPFVRADWVLDLMPYEDRGLYGYERGSSEERFSTRTWVQRDMCERVPWPFADGQFDFAVCSHTLEDVRDPVWVCGELVRVAKAGYVEVPSRLEEQAYGVQGPWVGWGHHHWLVDITPGAIEFVFKHHVVHGDPRAHFPEGFAQGLSAEERVQQLWWEGGFEFAERIFTDAEGLDGYLREFVAENVRRVASPARRHGGRRRFRWRGA